jgi:hypothetical protein
MAFAKILGSVGDTQFEHGVQEIYKQEAVQRSDVNDAI